MWCIVLIILLYGMWFLIFVSVIFVEIIVCEELRVLCLIYGIFISFVIGLYISLSIFFIVIVIVCVDCFGVLLVVVIIVVEVIVFVELIFV